MVALHTVTIRILAWLSQPYLVRIRECPGEILREPQLFIPLCIVASKHKYGMYKLRLWKGNDHLIAINITHPVLPWDSLSVID